MNTNVSHFAELIEKMIKTLASGKSRSFSDASTQQSLVQIAEYWHKHVSKIVKMYLPQNEKLYEIENTIDKILDWSGKSTDRAIALKSLRSLKRNVRKEIINGLIKTAPNISTDNGIESAELITASALKHLRGYNRETIRQINLCSLHLVPDGASLLLRKLVESILYDYYEIKSRQSEIQDSNGRWKQLKTIINHFIDHSGETISETLREFLKNSRILGGTAAHNHRLNLTPDDIKKISISGDLAIRELHNLTYQ